MATKAPDTAVSNEELEQLYNLPSFEPMWALLVLDCQCHSMDYVVAVFTQYFELDLDTAMLRMLEVHQDGQSELASGSEDEMAKHKEMMNAFGLRAKIEPLP